jgi:Zn finger protein HypA/HybF involved in hydrogenase expression
MSKSREDKPLKKKCPNCHQTHEPDFNETTKRYICPLCAESVDIQVIVEKKKRGIR